MPGPAISPMDHSTAGFSSPRDARKKSIALIHGGTSLKLSEGGESPVLEAHPGSPVDISKPRTSIANSLATQRLYHGSDEEHSRIPKSPVRREENIIRDGVAAKGFPFIGPMMENCEHEMRTTRKKSHGSQPFYIPAKVPEQEEVHYVPVSGNDKLSVDTAVESTEMDFEFEEDNGVWISAHPVAHSSRTSLATTNTATSTLVDEKSNQGGLTLDTSVGSSAASMVSSDASLYSATTNGSVDVYGWEEELDRKTSIEGHHFWEREVNRRLPSGGRTMGPRVRGNNGYDFQYSKRGPFDVKRRSLLHRVLNLSGSRKASTDDIVMSGAVPVGNYHCPSTSA